MTDPTDTKQMTDEDLEGVAGGFSNDGMIYSTDPLAHAIETIKEQMAIIDQSHPAPAPTPPSQPATASQQDAIIAAGVAAQSRDVALQATGVPVPTADTQAIAAMDSVLTQLAAQQSTSQHTTTTATSTPSSSSTTANPVFNQSK